MATRAHSDLMAMRFRTGCLRFLATAVPVAIAVYLNGNSECNAQVPKSVPTQAVASTAKRFASPQATAGRFVTAVNNQNWRDEYECYSAAQQSRFTYFVLLSTRELNESQDLLPELQSILQGHSFPLELLDRFPSQRLDLSNIVDQDEIQLAIQDQQEKTRKQQELWAREVQPMNINWAKLIEQLQPLLVENYRRHSKDSLVVQTGIAHHLGFHRFDRVSKIVLSGNRAEGSVVAIISDPKIEMEESVRGSANQGTARFATLVDRGLKNVGIRDKRVKRKPEKIAFVLEADDWKIDSVPFR